MAVATIDKGVTPKGFGPSTQAKPDPPLTKPKRTTTKTTETSKSSVTTENLNTGLTHKFMREFCCNYLKDANKLIWTLMFVPTDKGMKEFNWKTVTCSHKLMTWFEAKQLTIDTKLSRFGTDWAEYASLSIVNMELNEMGGFNMTFDASQYAPDQSQGGIHPPGVFQATISNADVEQNSAQTGFNFVVTFTTNAGEIRKYYVVSHEKQDTAKRGLQQLSALCACIGIQQLPMQDGGKMLIGRQMQVEIGPQNSKEGQEKGYTEIKTVMDLQGNVPGANPRSQPNPTHMGGGGFQPNNQSGGGFQPNNQGQPQGQGGFQPQGQNQSGGFQPQGQSQVQGQSGFQQQQPQGQNQGQSGGFNPQGQGQGGFQQQQPNVNQGSGFQPQGQGGFPQNTGGAPNGFQQQQPQGQNQSGGFQPQGQNFIQGQNSEAPSWMNNQS
ncbi:MAG TPA: hypothetical protein PK745_00200 [bacterium]|nr:hypothetical protein [bacterium]